MDVVLPALPSPAKLIARALVPGRPRPAPAEGLPNVRARVIGVRQSLDRLAAYNRVCGFTLRDTVPATWLHVLSFPLQTYLMGRRDFPFGLVGLVHVSNRIEVLRPVGATERLSITTWAADVAPHRRGVLFDMCGEIRAGDELVWRGISTYLSRGSSLGGPGGESPAGDHNEDTGGRTTTGNHLDGDGRVTSDGSSARGPGEGSTTEHAPEGRSFPGPVPPADAAPDPATEPDPEGSSFRGPAPDGTEEDGAPTRQSPDLPRPGALRVTGRWRLPADLGRQYAAVSGDINPIHLSALSARPFGFRGAIIHGMWTYARALAALDGRLPESYVVDMSFRKPIILPGTVSFGEEPGFRVAVMNAEGRPYLTGTVEG
jgi:hypothetical protein